MINQIPEGLRKAILAAEYRALVGTMDAHTEMTELLVTYSILAMIPFTKDHPLNLLTLIKMDRRDMIPDVYRWRKEQESNGSD